MDFGTGCSVLAGFGAGGGETGAMLVQLQIASATAVPSNRRTRDRIRSRLLVLDFACMRLMRVDTLLGYVVEWKGIVKTTKSPDSQSFRFCPRQQLKNLRFGT